MNVLFLDNETTWRGGQEQIFTLIRGLYERGIYVTLLAPKEAPLSQRVRKLGIAHFSGHWRGELSLWEIRTLRRILEDRQWDIVHFNTPCGIALAAFLSRRARVPVRILSRRVNFPLRGRISRWKYLYAADYIITVSSGIAATLVASGIPRDRVEVIYEGVDAVEVGSASCHRLYPDSNIVIGCAASLSEEKGHTTLLAAFSRLVSQRPAARLVLLGDGPLRFSLEDQARKLSIAEVVQFLGFQERVASFLRGCDIFVLPSLSEGLSSAILTAMAASLPVVASDIGGIPELVQHGLTGLLVPPQRPQILADALQLLVDAPELRMRYGKAGRQRVLEHFTLDRKVMKTLRIYRLLLSRAGRRIEVD
ncbi:MAG: glycosyltransferase family 4 protein [Acidobacteria bacterium]|nr:glycosyltransferase family 4 protein [Acidobacteriota bacterium]